MLIILGLRTWVRFLGLVTVTCTRCHLPAAQRLEERRRVLTVFFVPLLPLGRHTDLTCTFCGAVTEVRQADVPGLLAQAEPHPAASATVTRFGGLLGRRRG